MGLRFLELDPAYQEVIDRIVAVNTDEGRVSTLNFDFSRPATASQMPAVTDAALRSRADRPRTPALVVTAPRPVPAPAVTPIQLVGTRLRLALGRGAAGGGAAGPL